MKLNLVISSSLIKVDFLHHCTGFLQDTDINWNLNDHNLGYDLNHAFNYCILQYLASC